MTHTHTWALGKLMHKITLKKKLIVGSSEQHTHTHTVTVIITARQHDITGLRCKRAIQKWDEINANKYNEDNDNNIK